MTRHKITVRFRKMAGGALGIVLLSAGCSNNRGDGRGYAGGNLGVVEACPSSDPVCSDGGFPTYTRDLAPILEAKCIGCHSPNGEASDNPLTSYAEITAKDKSGRERGATSANFVVNCQMPPPPLAPVTNAERTVFYCWLAGKEPE